MEPISIVLEQKLASNNLKPCQRIEFRLIDSSFYNQNLSEICVSNLVQKLSNSAISQQDRSESHSQQIETIRISFEKTPQQNQELSEEISSQNNRAVVKIGREQKFKRSTNNSHKKFISVARRWLFKNNGIYVKFAFQNKFKAFRSTRTYFFIILAFIKCVMNEQKQRSFKFYFEREVSGKIQEYQKQIQNTTLENVKNFRADEITDLRFSIKACNVFFQGDIQKSIECVYKKDKSVVVKKHHFEEALRTVKNIQSQLLLPDSVEKMIMQFGNKKIKSKIQSMQNPSHNAYKLQTSNQPTDYFLFPETSRFSSGFGYSHENMKGKLFQIKKTSQEQQFNHNQLLVEEENEAIEFKDVKYKKVMNMMVVAPQTESNESIKVDYFWKKEHSMGFRPYRKQ